MKKEKAIRSYSITWFYPMILGYYFISFFPWKLVWESLEIILHISISIESVYIGTILLQCMIIFLLVIKLKWDMRHEQFGVKGNLNWKVKIILLIGMFLLTEYLSAIWWSIAEGGRKVSDFYSNSPLELHGVTVETLAFLIEVIACVVMEELLFRYLTCNSLKILGLRTGTIILIQAFLFSSFHGYDLWNSVDVFLFGIIIGIILFLTGSPAAGCILHAVYNIKVMSDGPAENFLFPVGCLICIIGILFEELGKRKKKRRNRYRKKETGEKRDYEIRYENE